MRDPAGSFDAADRRVVEIARGRTVPLRLHVGILPSLLQYLGRRTRALRRGAVDREAPAEVVRFATWPPLDIMRWGEYAARDASDLSDVADRVSELAARWSGDLVAALSCVAEEFRRDLWPDDRIRLFEAQDWLAAHLPAAKDDIVEGLRGGLMVEADEEPLDLVLVRRADEIAGGHSHPALVDVDRFAGAGLVEAVFHETGHELLGRGIGSPRSALARLDEVARSCGPSGCGVHDVLHLALFALAGGLVRKHFDRSHRPLLFENARLARSLRRIGGAVTAGEATSTLESFANGEIDLPALAKFFIGRSRTPGSSPG